MGRMPSRTPIALCLILFAWTGLQIGCTSPIIRSQTPENESLVEETKTRKVSDLCRPWGLRDMTVEGISVTSNLDSTGSDPPAGPQRQMILEDMKRRGVDEPNTFLSLPTTSLVIVRGKIPPGARKGDRMDVEIMVPSRSTTASLRNGWLMQTRLQEMAVLGNRLRTGEPLALASGAVLVDAFVEGEGDETAEVRGRILGGALVTKPRSLGLLIESESRSARASAYIGDAINRRFHTFDRGTKRGVATPKRDSFIELAVHARYRNNLVRYLRVIQAIPLRETASGRIDRLSYLEGELLEPKKSLDAAIQLEAIGQESIPVLLVGLESESPIVRFASAEALAYLEKTEAIPHLQEAAMGESAFRWHAITALGSMVHSDAREALSELIHESSDETRYAAFAAILDSNPRDPVVRGEVLGEAFSLHEIPTGTEPLVHIRKSKRPEIVLFGQDIRLATPTAIFAGKQIMVKSDGPNRFKVSRFELGKEDLVEYCSDSLDDIIRMIVKLDGSYTDVVAAINDAKRNGSLSARVKFDSLPKPGRAYDLETESVEEPIEAEPLGPAEVDLSEAANHRLMVHVRSVV